MARRQYFIFSALTSKFYVCYFWTMQKIVKYFCCNNEENISTKLATGNLPCKICIFKSSFDKMTVNILVIHCTSWGALNIFMLHIKWQSQYFRLFPFLTIWRHLLLLWFYCSFSILTWRRKFLALSFFLELGDNTIAFQSSIKFIILLQLLSNNPRNFCKYSRRE